MELYYTAFQSSNLAKAIAVWAIISFLDGGYIRSVLLTTLTTYIQIIVGLDLMIVLAILMTISYFKREGVDFRTLALSCMIYLFIAGSYLIVIYLARTGDAGALSQHEYFDLMFTFRHPHHFIFSSFALSRKLVFFTLALIGLLFFYSTNKQLFRFMLIALVILILYIVAVDEINSVFIANFQWYKMTIWLKFLGMIALFSWMEKLSLRFEFSMLRISVMFLAIGVLYELISLLLGYFDPKKILVWTVGLMLIVLGTWLANNIKIKLAVHQALLVIGIICITAINLSPDINPFNVFYQFGKQKNSNPEIDISKKIKNVTPVDAVFIQPFNITALKYYGQRSSYVEFKANVRTKEGVQKWYPRITEVYGVSKEMELKGFSLKKAADQNFMKMDDNKLDMLKNRGVTHMLTFKEHRVSGRELILENDKYKVFRL